MVYEHYIEGMVVQFDAYRFNLQLMDMLWHWQIV